jgi:hypothetical protein
LAAAVLYHGSAHCDLDWIELNAELDLIRNPIRCYPTLVLCNSIQSDPIRSDPIESNPIQSHQIQFDPIRSNQIQSDPIRSDPARWVDRWAAALVGKGKEMSE